MSLRVSRTLRLRSNTEPRNSMADIIQHVLARIEVAEDDIIAILGDTDVDYEPSVASDDSDKSTEQIFEPQLEHLIVKKKDSYDDCAICLEAFRYRQHARRTSCNHTFHKKCIEQWLYKHDHRSMRCPVCRTSTLPDHSQICNLRRSRRISTIDDEG